MGPRITIIFIDDDETVELLPFVQYEKLLRRDIDFKISKYAGTRISYVPRQWSCRQKLKKQFFCRICSLLFLQEKEIWIHE